MNDLKYSDSFRPFRLHHSENYFGPKRLCEAVRAVCQTANDRLTTADGRRRGLRMLSVGAAHGYLLEDALTELGDEVSFERVDCIEPNDVMSLELETRMITLACKYNFESKVYKRKFSSEEAPAFLPNDFYDLIIFSHVICYLDDPGGALLVSLCRLANENGRLFLTSTTNEAYFNASDEIRSLADDGPFIPCVLFDLHEFLRTNTEITVVSRSIDEAGLLMHLALKPAHLCVSEQDAAIRKMGDGLLNYIAGRDMDTVLKISRAQVQDIVRKYTVDSYGFPMLPMRLENFLLARKA